MALAIVRFKDRQGDKTRFHIDIGITNRFYAYAIGDEHTLTRNGLTFLENSRFVSPVFGPVPPPNPRSYPFRNTERSLRFQLPLPTTV